MMFLSYFSAFGHFQRLSLPNCSTIDDVVSSRCKLFQFGDMRNKQTSVLGGGNLTIAMKNVEKMFHIGITEFYDASVCLLSFQLGQYNEDTCSCAKRAARAKDMTQIVAKKNAAKRQFHFTPEDLAKIASVTLLDTQLYIFAVHLFISRIQQAEVLLQNHILCKEVDDVAYINTLLGDYNI